MAGSAPELTQVIGISQVSSVRLGWTCSWAGRNPALPAQSDDKANAFGHSRCGTNVGGAVRPLQNPALSLAAAAGEESSALLRTPEDS